ncbi:hypothetical protein DW062_07215 [Clostridium sp. AF43-10]|nr:hypothetical protein DW062_07215 [Clostridium sp. AF43-10]
MCRRKLQDYPEQQAKHKHSVASKLGKKVKTGRNAPTDSQREASKLGKKVKTGRNAPTDSQREAS